jgi:uncharacterized protein YecT (DUF1311 family)
MRYSSWYRAGVVVMLLGVAACSDSGAEQAVAYPSNQTDFFALNKDCESRYAAGQNEIQKSLAFNECNKARLAFAQAHGISGWVGRISDISTDQGADVVSVTIDASVGGFDMAFGTVTDRLSDLTTGSMITQSNPLFNVLAQMKIGDTVAFDAEFLPHPEANRGIWESSLTEQGSMASPEVFVKFTSIRPYSALSAAQVVVADKAPAEPPQAADVPVGEMPVESSEQRPSDEQTYAAIKSSLRASGYSPDGDAAQTGAEVDGDPADCGNAGCTARWSDKAGNRKCVGISINESIPEAQWKAFFVECDEEPQPVAEAVAPSFDCAAASKASEHAICDNDTLARVDAYTAGMYECLLGAAADATDLRASQRAWLRKRDECGADIGCLRGAYGDIANRYMQEAAFQTCQSSVEAAI